MSSDPDPTKDLVLASKSGDTMAQDALLRQHLAGLRAFVRLQSDAQLRLRESESDLVQSICREVLGDLDGFEYRDAVSFRGWLYTVALSKIREKGRFHRAAQRTASREAGSMDADGALHEQYASIFSPSEQAIAREAEAQFETAFDALTEDHRQVILMSRVLRLPHREIATRTGKTEVAVRSLLSRALVALSRELGPNRPAP